LVYSHLELEGRQGKEDKEDKGRRTRGTREGGQGRQGGIFIKEFVKWCRNQVG